MNRLSAGLAWNRTRIFAHDDDGAALRVRAGEIRQRQRVGRHVYADALHRRDGATGSICEPLIAAAASASLFAWYARMPFSLSRGAISPMVSKNPATGNRGSRS